MSKLNQIKPMLKPIGKAVERNLPTILAFLATLGLATSVATAIKETPNAQSEIQKAKAAKRKEVPSDEAEDDISQIDEVNLTPWEMFKVLAPVYWPCAASTGMTAAFIWLSHRAHSKKYAAVLAALSLNEKQFREYKDKVKEVFGEKKEQEVHKELAKDYAMNSPDDGEIVLTGNGTYLCYEPLSHTYFRSSINAVKSGVNNFNEYLLREGEASVAELCYHLDIPLVDPYYVEEHLMWYYDPVKKNMLHVSFNYSGNPQTNEPCMVLDYDSLPTWE